MVPVSVISVRDAHAFTFFSWEKLVSEGSDGHDVISSGADHPGWGRGRTVTP